MKTTTLNPAPAALCKIRHLFRAERRDPVPAPVRHCLADPALTRTLLDLLRRLSGYQNLTNDQRRERALMLSRVLLAEEGRPLSDHDRSILIALLYARVKAETPFLIAPEPKRW